MELKAKGSFYRDLNKFSNRELAVEVRRTLERMMQAKKISQIPALKKLKKFTNIKFVLGRHELADFSDKDFMSSVSIRSLSSPQGLT